MNTLSASQPTSRRRRRTSAKPSAGFRDPLPLAVYVFVVICLIFGGGQGQFGIASSLIGISGLALMMIAIWRGGLEKFADLPALPRWAIILAVALPFLQLVPLPWVIWSELPGHAQRAQILSEIGLSGTWQPLTMALIDTAYTALIALIMFGFLIALLLLEHEDIRRLLLIVVSVVGLAAAIGVIQFTTNSSLLQFHSIAHRDAAIGFFANKNHMSLTLVCLVPIIFELWIRGVREKGRQAAYLGLLAAVLIPLVVATNSRAGILLVLAALFACTLQIYRGRWWHLVLGVIAAILALTILVLSVPNMRDMVDRFGDTQSYGRIDILIYSLPLAERFWTFGAGIGSFPSVYESMEQLSWVFPFTVNHAHNDYLEILIEAGILGAIIVLLNLAAVGFAFVAWWQRRDKASGRRRDELDFVSAGFLIIALFALHSLVDYPIRRVGTLTLLMIGIALVYRPLPWLMAKR